MPLAAIPTSASPADHRAGGADALADTSDAAARCGTVTVALPANIEMIPDEVLLGILSDLDFASRHSVGRVNRRFHRLLEPGFAAGRMLARIRWLQAPADVAIALRDIGALERDYQPALLAELATRLRTQGFPSAPAGLAAVLDATMRLPPPL